MVSTNIFYVLNISKWWKVVSCGFKPVHIKNLYSLSSSKLHLPNNKFVGEEMMSKFNVENALGFKVHLLIDLHLSFSKGTTGVRIWKPKDQSRIFLSLYQLIGIDFFSFFLKYSWLFIISSHFFFLFTINNEK